MKELETIPQLLNGKAELQSRVSIFSFDGSIEVKTIGSEKYIYVRKKEAGKNHSVYIDKYSDELYALAFSQSLQLRKIKKQIRVIEKNWPGWLS